MSETATIIGGLILGLLGTLFFTVVVPLFL